jgi:NADPH:quinone reductase-like Zn-dependent oxidoreductase
MRKDRNEGDRLMSKAVRFDDYGGIEVLEVRDVARPEPGPDQVLVAVRAAGINPSEAKIRAGLVREIFPATFPSGQGSDLAGVVEEVGAGVNGVAVGDEVIGLPTTAQARPSTCSSRPPT